MSVASSGGCAGIYQVELQAVDCPAALDHALPLKLTGSSRRPLRVSGRVDVVALTATESTLGSALLGPPNDHNLAESVMTELRRSGDEPSEQPLANCASSD
jgi:hypothetical protein